ncbi:MarR family transcriptional regulator [Brevundimonas sp.]|jgi:DNA-binding MarR family transcriptional regulator|uniref:MarR family winged helix-turn-helix transcriptional regulator n=1 Tax=Brevundimonas sp. TaxID=1871086 RepID=UPI002ED8EA14
MSNLPEPFASTLHIRDHCLCLHAQQAARALSRRFDEVFRPLGLTSGQFSLLNSLNRPTPPTISQVAETLAMDRSTVTANLKPLERSGAVVATIDPDDRRGRRVGLTEAGQALLARAKPLWVETHRQLEADLLDGNGDRVRGDLKRLLGR